MIKIMVLNYTGFLTTIRCQVEVVTTIIISGRYSTVITFTVMAARITKCSLFNLYKYLSTFIHLNTSLIGRAVYVNDTFKWDNEHLAYSSEHYRRKNSYVLYVRMEANVYYVYELKHLSYWKKYLCHRAWEQRKLLWWSRLSTVWIFTKS